MLNKNETSCNDGYRLGSKIPLAENDVLIDESKISNNG